MPVSSHRQVGAYAAQKQIDRILCVGERARHMFLAACDNVEETERVTHFPSLEALLAALGEERREYIPDGSTVLIKASHAMEFEKVLEFLKQE